MRNRSRNALLASFAALFLLPALFFSAGLASSFAFGTTLTAAIAILASLISTTRHPYLKATTPWVLITVMITGIHLLSVSISVSTDLVRAMLSLVLMSIIVFGAASLADILTTTKDIHIRKATQWAMTILLLFGALGSLRILQPYADIFFKPVFPFPEPSLFALVLTPTLIAACAVSKPRVRWIFLSITLLETLALQNLTMAVGLLLAACVSLPRKQVLIASSLAIPLIFAVDLSYYTQRLAIFGDTPTNLSALVYLQGWQIIEESLIRSSGFGIGFQQLGINHIEVEASQSIKLLVDDNLNLKDGSFGLAKIVSEFGLFSLFLIPLYLNFLIRSISLLRSTINHVTPPSPALLIASSATLSYSIDLLIRGTGYFTPSSMLALTGFLILSNIEKFPDLNSRKHSKCNATH